MSSLKEKVIDNFSDMAVVENFRISAEGMLTKRDGFSLLAEFEDFIRGYCYAGGDKMYVVAGSEFYYVWYGEALCLGELTDSVFEDEETCVMYMYAGIVYIVGGGAFYCYDTNDEFAVLKNCAYAPIYVSKHDDYPKEKLNNITSRVREVDKIPESSFVHTIRNSPTDIDHPIVDGVQLLPSQYTIEQGNSLTTIRISDKSVITEGFFSVEYTINPNYFAPEKERYRNCKSAYVYEGKSGVRVLLYNSDEGVVFYSEPSEHTQYVGNYFPRENVLVAPNFEKIRSIAKYGDETLVFTDATIYTLSEYTRTSGEDVIFRGFGLAQLKKNLGIDEHSGVAEYGSSIYFINSSGLYSLTYNPIESKYTYRLMNIPENVGIPKSDYQNVRVHIDLINNEIWCQNGNVFAVYSFTSKRWYRFSGFNPTKLFAYNNNSAFIEANKICVFKVGEKLDCGKGFEAYVETRNLDLGNIFAEKTIFGFGASFERCEGAALECTLKSDKGSSFTFTVKADDDNSDTTPVVKRTHARLSNCYYVICRISSPPNAAPTNLRSILISYKVMGGNE